MCMLLESNLSFVTFFRKLKLVALCYVLYYYLSKMLVGTLCAQLPLQLYAKSFETLHMFWSGSEDARVV